MEKKTCNSISFIYNNMTPSISLIFFAKKAAHPFAVNLRSSSTMNVVGTSFLFFFFLVTCSDWPFVDDFFSGQFFSSITETMSLLYPSFSLNYVWILLLSLLLYSLHAVPLQSNYFHSKWYVV